jgi:hypothetical protein
VKAGAMEDMMAKARKPGKLFELVLEDKEKMGMGVMSISMIHDGF